MSGVRKIEYAAKDPLAGGTNLNKSENSFIQGRNISIFEADKHLGEIQRVIRTDYVLRYLNHERATELIKNYEIDYPKAIEIGKRWYSDGRLAEMKCHEDSVETVFNAISVELTK